MQDLIKIGIFYDGNYFLHVSNYYNYHHDRKARVSIGGLQDLVRDMVAKEESVDRKLCRIVDAHYFRGRLNAALAEEYNKLYAERAFDDILMSEGIVTHYLPLKISQDGHRTEKGIDVWLALEAYELAIHRSFDVVVLIACDGDYVPLARKLNGLGIRVMVLGWDFEATSPDGKIAVTRTSHDLLEEASYPVSMHEYVEEQGDTNPLIDKLFVKKSATPPPPVDTSETEGLPALQGEVMTLKNGYGFIQKDPNNVFFHYTDLVEGEFSEVREGDVVSYLLYAGGGRDGGDVARSVKVIEANGPRDEIAYEETETSDEESGEDDAESEETPENVLFE